MRHAAVVATASMLAVLVTSNPARADERVCERSRCGPGGRFAVGIGKGHLHVADDSDGHQGSLVGRLRVPFGFDVELEVAHARLDGDGEANSAGLALERTLFTRGHLSPYAAIAAGGGRIEDAPRGDRGFGYTELGGGLLVRRHRLGLALDLRAGIRHGEDIEGAESEPGVAARQTAPRPPPDDEEEHQRYCRGRLMLLFYF